MNSPHKQQGLSLVLAIFIVVVLSLLGAAMINILSGGSESVAREVISTRALFLAESGAQRKLVEIFPPGGGVQLAECAADNYDSTELAGIQGCSTQGVEISCSVINVPPVNYFTITSTATCGPADSPAVRVIEIQARDGL